MPTIKANGINIFYQQEGQGPNLILIAGLRADHRIWQKIIESLAESFTVTIFDNRGTGQTDTPDSPYSIEMMAEDVIGLMDALNINKSFILGHSMGGFILQALLSNHPERFSKAILVCSRLLHAPAYLLNNTINTELTTLGISRDLIIKNSATFIFGEDFLNSSEKLDNFVQSIQNNPHPQSLVGMKRQAEACNQFDKLVLLEKISTPLLAIYGRDDLIARINTIEILQQKVPNLTVKTFDNCGHMPQIEKPAEFKKAMKSFLLPHNRALNTSL